MPDNKAGYNRSHEGVGQDGADVSEEMSLRQTGTHIYLNRGCLVLVLLVSFMFGAIKTCQYVCKCKCENLHVKKKLHHCIVLHCNVLYRSIHKQSDLFETSFVENVNLSFI